MEFHITLHAYPQPTDSSEIRWTLRIEQDYETYRAERHWSGTGKAQDDVVAVAELVLNDALGKVQQTLSSELAQPLF